MNSHTPSKATGKRRWLQIGAILLVVGVVYFLWTPPDQWGFRRELPWSARDIQEWHWSDGFLPDCTYYLKASITDEEFKSYIAKLGLTQHTPARRYSDSSDVWLNWRAESRFGSKWWDPSESLDETFVWQGNDVWIFAKYERGHLYLKSLNH